MSIMDEIKKQHIELTIEQENDLIAEYKRTRNPALREKLIRSKYRLAINYANKYACDKYQFDDALGDAIAGICMAIEKHNPEKGPFRLACGIYIRANILGSINDYTKLVKVTSYHRHGQRVQDAIEDYERTGDARKTGKKYGFGWKTIIGYATAIAANNSTGVGIDDMRSEYEAHHDAMVREEIEREIKRALRIFKIREREIIKMKYGFNGGKEMTARQIAKKVGVSCQRVFQICDAGTRTLAEKFPWMREWLR